MGKTPVLLAFGRHWDQAHGGIIQPDRDFYRKAALPFIEKRIAGEGRTGVLISEYRLVVDIYGSGPEEQERYVATQLKAHEEMVLAAMRETLDLGRPAPYGLHAELDWGLFDRLMELNRDYPGWFRSIIERQTPGQVTLAYAFETPCDGLEPGRARIVRYMDSIRTSIAVSKHRSRELISLIEDLRREDPDVAIIATRGYAHAGMSAWLDPERYDVEAHSGGTLVPRFSSDAIIESYSHELSDAEVERYALDRKSVV